MTNQEHINKLHQQWKDDPSSYDEDQAQHIQDWLRDTNGEDLDKEWLPPVKDIVVEYNEYLDELRESGVTNMFGAVPYLMDNFPWLSRREAKEVLLNWMDTFAARHGKI
jgi:hypothetical protein